MKHWQETLFGTLLASVIILAFLLNRSCRQERVRASILYAAHDTLTQVRDELGREKSTTALLYGNISELKNVVAGKDSTLARLRELVNRRTISATVVANTTSNKVESQTVVIVNDTVLIDTCRTVIYPTYRTSFENQWERFNIVATNDNFSIDYKVFNQYEFVQDWQRYGFMGLKKRAVTSVKNLNPNTETKELRTFTVQCKCNKVHWFAGGVLAGALGMAMLK